MQSLPGRLIIEVNMERVKELRELGLTWTRIAETLHISRQTLYIPPFRTLDGSGLMGYTEELDGIQACKANHPNDEETFVTGRLRSLQINVPRRRIRGFIYWVDPSGTEERAGSTIRRRTYHVGDPMKCGT